MKKVFWSIGVTVALLFGCTAAGIAQEYYTLPEVREQAVGGWHETYTDKYGRDMTVDLDIEVYGEDVAPVLKARWHEPQEVREKYNSPSDRSNEAENRGNPTLSLYDSQLNIKVDFDTVYGAEYGNDMTYGEFCELAEEVKALYGDEQTYLYEQPKRFWVPYNLSKKTGELIVPAFYVVLFYPTEFGLPVIADASETFEKDGYGPSITPQFYFRGRSNSEYGVDIVDFDVDEVLAEDIPLCSVEQVIAEAEEFFETGYVYDVQALRFGYVVFTDPELQYGKPISAYDTETWYYVPSWVMDCTLRQNPRKAEVGKFNTGVRHLIFNAQTGEMFDFFDRSLCGYGDYRYKGFISWDDVR